MKRLEKQLQILPDLHVASAYKTSQNLEVLKVTSVRTVCEIVQSIPVAQEMFCGIDNLLNQFQQQQQRECSLLFAALKPIFALPCLKKD